MNTLKSLRESQNLTQEQLSKISGVNKTQISRIERGVIKMENISLVNACALAKALHITAEDFIT